MFNFNRKEKGQGLVEYALILVLIAIVVIAAMQALGTTVDGTFTSVDTALGGEGSGGDNSAGNTLTNFGYQYYHHGQTEDAAISAYCNIADVPSGAGYNLYTHTNEGYTVDGYGQDFPEITFQRTGTCP